MRKNETERNGDRRGFFFYVQCLYGKHCIKLKCLFFLQCLQTELKCIEFKWQRLSGSGKGERGKQEKRPMRGKEPERLVSEKEAKSQKSERQVQKAQEDRIVEQ